MKVQVKRSPRGASGEGVPVEKYLECLRKIFASQGITHLTTAKFSTPTKQETVSYIIRQKWNKTVIETIDLLQDDENVVF